MPAFTTRLGLYLPGGGSTGTIMPDEQVDIDDINENQRKIDDAVGTTVCTSTTRPASPYPGQIITETDTKQTYAWVGGQWTEIVARPFCVLSFANKSIPNGLDNILGGVGIDYSEESDIYGWHNPSVSSERITPNIPGRYTITANMGWAANASGVRHLRTVKNTDQSIVGAMSVGYTLGSIDTGGPVSVTSKLVPMNGTTDFFHLRAGQGSGGALLASVRVAVQYEGPL